MFPPKVVYMNETHTNAIWSLLGYIICWFIPVAVIFIVNTCHEVLTRPDDENAGETASYVPILGEMATMSRDAFLSILGGLFLTVYLSMDGITQCVYVSTWSSFGFFLVHYLMTLSQMPNIVKVVVYFGFIISNLVLYGCALSYYDV